MSDTLLIYPTKYFDISRFLYKASDIYTRGKMQRQQRVFVDKPETVSYIFPQLNVDKADPSYWH